MPAVNQDLVGKEALPVGDYREIEVVITEPNLQPVYPANLVMYYTFSRNERSNAIFTKSSSTDEIVIEMQQYKTTGSMHGNIFNQEESEDETAVAVVKLNPTDTKDLRGGFYYHKLVAYDTASQKPYTVMIGKVLLLNTISIDYDEPHS